MSREGPVLSVHQHHTPPAGPRFKAMAASPRNRHLLSHTRERAASTNSSLLDVPENAASPPQLQFYPAPATTAPNIDLNASLPSGRTLNLPSSRSYSLPRGSRSGSAEPQDSLSQSSPSWSLKATISPRFMRRTATVDTNLISKEEYEDFTQLNQYKVVGIIGSGSYGIVHKATTDENEVYAMKIVGKSRLRRKSFPMRPRSKQGPRGRGPAGRLGKFEVKSPLDNVHREIAILKKLDHPNVVNLTEVLDDPHEDELILVFEYIPKGSVMKEIPTTDTLSEEQSRQYFIDLILGLEYLHSQHIIHRDIKPDNLLLGDDDHIKIADFGVSEEIDTSDTHLYRSAGTPAFTAPECLDATTKSYKGQAVDIWAAGITLYCFMYGKVPFSAKVITELYDIIRNEDIEFPSSPTISPELKDLLLKLLEKDSSKRITIPEIRKHPWFCNTERIIPSREENCQEEIFVNQEEIATAFKPFRTPIHILVMIKQMAKKRSFTNPYSPKSSPRNSPKASPRVSPATSPRHSPTPPVSPVSPTPFKRRANLLKSHQTPTICVDSPDDLELASNQ